MIRRKRATWKCACCALTLLVGACGVSEFGEIRVPADQQHVLSPAGGGAAPLSLPADHPFAIHVKKSGQNPGPDGQARGQSDATGAGNGYCLAEAANGGSAEAEFDLGHRIDNRGGLPQQAVIDVAFDLKQSASVSQQPAPETVSTCNLYFVVMDIRRKVLARVPVVQATSDESPGEAVVHEQRSLTVRLEPRQSYDVLLFGRVEAAAAAQQRAAARLEVQNLKMRLKFTPVATAPAEPLAAARK